MKVALRNFHGDSVKGISPGKYCFKKGAIRLNINKYTYMWR